MMGKLITSASTNETMTFDPNRKTCSDTQARFKEVCKMSLSDIIGEPGNMTAAELEAWMAACQEVAIDLYERLLYLENVQAALSRRVA